MGFYLNKYNLKLLHNKSEMQGENQKKIDDFSSWAEALQKVFRKKPKKAENEFMLLCKVKKQEDSEDEKLKAEMREKAKKRKLKRQYHEMAHVKPDPLKKDHEQYLKRIATKGVVHLFTAIEKHRKSTGKDLKQCRTESQRDKVRAKMLKKNFSDIVEGGVVTSNENKEDSKKAGWKVLSDDFMPKGEVQDWDKED